MSGPITATFRVYAPDLNPHYDLNIVGNIAVLGSWKPENGKLATKLSHGWFEAVVHLPQHFRMSYFILHVLQLVISIEINQFCIHLNSRRTVLL